MKQFIDRIESLTTVIGLLIVLHSIIGWYSFVELLWDTSELCDALGVKNCEYPGWIRLSFGLIIETIVGFILLGFNLQNLERQVDYKTQQEDVVSQKSEEISRVLDYRVSKEEQSDGQEKRCRYWGNSGRCETLHTNSRYCDEHMDLVDIFRLPGKD
tara:strand:- start:414 stop:884 length:471 start_codon:yes stop_codon:yes gene_type:complete